MTAAKRPDPGDALRTRRASAGRERAKVDSRLRTDPVKPTFDISPALYRQVKVWAATNDVTVVDTVRRLFAELLADEELARRIQAGGQDTM